MDNIREWLSDNLRYIALGLIAIIILAVLFFGGRALLAKKSTTVQSNTSASQSTSTSAAQKGPDLGDNVKVNSDEEITSLMKNYFAALQAGDEKSLAKYVTVVDSSLFKDYIESYKINQIYLLPGENADSKLVFTTVNVKYKNINTEAPALKQFYVSKNNNGNYIIQSSVLSDTAKKLVETAASDSGIVNLTNDINSKFSAAVASDSKLKELYDLIHSIANGSDTKSTTTEKKTDTTQSSTNKKVEATDPKKTESTESKKTENQNSGNQTVTINPSQSNPTPGTEGGVSKTAITELNIVKDPSTQEVVGQLSAGQTVVVLSVDELGWARVNVDGVDGYVADYLLQPNE